VEDGEPVLGVVSGPARSVLYAAARGGGAFRRGAEGVCSRIQVRLPASQPLRVLGSRSFGDAKLDRKLEELGPQERISLGSALKFGLLAEGAGDLYVRRGPTSEWDTAAGHAVVLEAGGSVVDLAGRPLRYNVRADVINPSFIAYGDRSRDWVALLAGL
jgi:3'(2'), 5'-bisphosphate nucleotidase